ncbi:hypothetical protein S40288_10902 [Stachybotrys chartarum IBT 40288]|nr:hypothetical protein S40288_10902 [Stachybotrys chartarum IBT 40288]
MSTSRAVQLLLLISAVWPAGASPGFSIEPGIDCSTNTSCSSLHVESWDRLTCMTKISTRQRKEPGFALNYNNEEYFRRLPGGGLANTSEDMMVTMKGCEEFCGTGTFYWDAGPRITTWIVPVVLLLSNIELSPIDKRRFITMIHAIGDPIDSFWSILHKMYVWRRLYAIGLEQCQDGEVNRYSWISLCIGFIAKLMHEWEGWKIWARMWRQRLKRWKQWRALHLRLPWNTREHTAVPTAPQHDASGEAERESVEDAIEQLDEQERDRDNVTDRARVIATVLAGFEEISGAQIKSETYYKMVMKRLGCIGPLSRQSHAAWQEWRHCARVLADARTNEMSRTLLAIFIYVFGVAAALYEDVGGGNTSKPGGRIGSAVFLMWLVPMTLLSNTVGAFTSRRTCLTIMRLFVERCRAAMQKEAEEARHASHQSQPSVTNASNTGDLSEHGSSASPAVVPDGTAVHGPPGAMTRVPTLNIGSPALEAQSPGLLSPPAAPRLHEHNRARSDDYYIPAATRTSRSTSPRASTPSTFLQMEPGALPSRSFGNALAPTQMPARSRARSLHTSRPDPDDIFPSGVALRSVTYRDHSTAPRLPEIAFPPALTTSTDDAEEADIGRGIGQDARNRRQRPSSEVDPAEWDFSRPSGSADGGMSGRTLEPLLPPWEPATPHFQAPNYAGPDANEISDNGRVPLVAGTSWHMYFTWLQPLGGMYTYRPWKLGYRVVSETSHAQYAPSWFLFSLSVFPVLLSATGAFIIIFYAVPIGFSCRHVWVVGVTVAWLGSVAMTTWLHSAKPWGLSDRTLWVLVTIKDGIVGIPSLSLVFFSTTGLFNNCYCWSASMWNLPRGTTPFVPLITSDDYDHHAQVIYSPVVFGCLAAQLAFFAFVIVLWWDGVYVVRWDEERCCREWRHEVSDGGRDISHKDDDLYLLFWFWKSELDAEERDRIRKEADERRRRSSRLSRFSLSHTPAQTPQGGATTRRPTTGASPLYHRIPQSHS